MPRWSRLGFASRLVAALAFAASALVALNVLGVPDGLATVEEIQGYTEWEFVRGPYRVDPSMAGMCIHHAFAGHPGSGWGHEHFPFVEVEIRVYANDVAAKTFEGESEDAFAPGSVIVKEKLVDTEEKPVESLGVMVKREPGFDPERGDWEFLYLASKKRIARGFPTLRSCYDCHQKEEFARVHTVDYVFVERYSMKDPWAAPETPP